MNNEGGIFRKITKDGKLSWVKVEPTEKPQPKPREFATEDKSPGALCSFCGLELDKYSDFNAHSLDSTSVMCSMCLKRMSVLAKTAESRRTYESLAAGGTDMTQLAFKVQRALGDMAPSTLRQLTKLVMRVAIRNAAIIAGWKSRGEDPVTGLGLAPIRAALVGPNASHYFEAIKHAMEEVGAMLVEGTVDEALTGDAQKRLSWSCMDDPRHIELGGVFFLDGYARTEGDSHAIYAVEDGLPVPRGVWKIMLNTTTFE